MCCSQEEQSDADSPLDGLDSGFTGRAADLEPASDEAAGVATPPPECVAPPPIVAHDGGGSDGSIGPFILIRVPGPTDQTGDAALFPHPAPDCSTPSPRDAATYPDSCLVRNLRQYSGGGYRRACVAQ